MAKPTIDWSWDHLPSNRDEVKPLGMEKIGDDEVWFFYNHTQQKFFFECDGDYGIFKPEA